MASWKVLQSLSRQGTREIFEAVTPQGRRVALKLLSGQSPKAANALFENEVRTLAHLRHPSLVPVLGYEAQSLKIFGEERGPSYWMEFVEGHSLLEASRGASIDELLVWFRQALEVLDYLHGQDVLHGDLSPKNILIDPRHRLRIIDPSIGFLEEQAADLATLPYMAPERLDGRRLRSGDIFSLGTLFYEVFAGRHPRASCNSLQEILRADAAPLGALAPSLQARSALACRVIDHMILNESARRLGPVSLILKILKEDVWADAESAEEAVYPARMYGADDRFEAVSKAIGGVVRVSAVFAVHGRTGVGKSRFIQESALEARMKGLEPSLFPDIEHFSEEQRASLIGFLRRLEPSGRLVLLEWNDDLLSSDHRRFCDALLTSDLASEILLTNLDVTQVFSLASSVIGEARARDLAAVLHDQTDGNPALLMEALRFVKSHPRSPSLKLPPLSRLEDLLSLRLSRCSERQRRVLNLLAAADSPVSWPVSWKDITLLFPEGGIGGDLQYLVNLELLREERSLFRLAVPALGDRLLRDLSEKEVHNLHRRWFLVLKNEAVDHPRRLHHALFLKKREDVVTGAPAACERLLDQRRFEECVSWIDRCLTLLEDPCAISRLLRIKLNALNAQGRYRDALSCADRWFSLNASDEPETLRRVKYWVITGQGHENLGEEDEAVRRLTQGLADAAGHEAEPPIRPWIVKAMNLLGQAASKRSDLAGARTYFERAISLESSKAGSNPSSLRAEAERGLAAVLARQSDWEGARRLLQEARSHYQERKDLLGEFWAWIQEGNLAVERGDLKIAEEAYGEAERSAEATKSDLRIGIAWNNQGHLRRLRGDTVPSLDLLNKAREIFLFLGNENDLAQNQKEIELAQAAVGRPAPQTLTLNDGGRMENRSMESALPLLTSLNEDLLHEEDMHRVLNRLMDAAMRISGADCGFLVLRGGEAGGPIPGFEIAVARNVAKQELQTDVYAFSLSAVRRALQTGRLVVTDNALVDPLFRDARSVQLQQLKSIAALPVRGTEGVLGVFYLDHRFQQGLFEGELLELLETFASIAGLALQKGRLVSELKRSNAELSERVETQASQVQRLEEEVHQSRLLLKNEYSDIIGRAPKMIEVLTLVDKITESKIPVWIYGESGTGKESIARALHFNSSRAKKAFVTENCSALPENLLESELFGHKKGAFTHATADKKGILQYADGGTIFLDEIADMSLALQAKLLRFLQEGEIRPIGSHEVVRVDVRVVSASNRDLAGLVKEGKFREDLFYRLNGVSVRLPALRDRREDIPLLAEHFLKKIAEREKSKDACSLATAVLKIFVAYPWPGNIRELQNAIETAVLFAEDGTVTPKSLHFKPVLMEGKKLVKEMEAAKLRSVSLPPILEETLRAIRDQCYHKGRAAKALGISRRSLYARLERAGVETDLESLKGQIDKYLG